MWREEEIVTLNAYYDRAEAIERLGGDEALFSGVAEAFVGGQKDYCAALASALAAADADALRREAHTVKSMLATFSCESGRELAQRLELLAASGELAGADLLTESVIAAVRQLADALSREQSG
jgi:HPt (histidine-containing phosphotransfer) domain-containing protein